MKMNINNIRRMLWFAAAIVSGIVFQACEDEPDKYKIANGKPEIQYVRMANVNASDSLITAAYMDNMICLVGKNLRSIVEMYFNDQQAILNTSYITDNTLIVTVPKNLSDNPTDKIYMVNSKNDTVTYDFKVLVPAPVVNSISCEYAHDGDLVTINGDYLLSYEVSPLKIDMAGNLPVTDITNITKTAVTFRIPQGAQKGYINVTTKYGTSRSKFQFRDDRNVILDWDNSFANGWRPGVVQSTNPDGISGGYVVFKGELLGESTKSWAEDGFSFNYWPAAGTPDAFPSTEWDKMNIKFEIYIPTSNPWKACALQMIFTPSTVSDNSFIANEDIPRGLWIPWKETGSYDTNNEWRTITLPLSGFKYTHAGGVSAKSLAPGSFAGLTFFVYAGGVDGVDCSPVIYIDNIRVVPAE